MWKLILAFIAFAALAMFVIMKGGDSLDMSGEKHGTEAHEAAPPAAAPSPVPAAAPAAPASEPAPAK